MRPIPGGLIRYVGSILLAATVAIDLSTDRRGRTI
jgi:hypothetical protein